AVTHRDVDEMRELWRSWWCKGIGDRSADLLKEPPQSRGRDDEFDRRLVGYVAVGVRDMSWYAQEIAGGRVMRFQAVLACHHTEFVGPGQELNGRPEHIERLSGRLIS